jgi:hypothetical protein
VFDASDRAATEKYVREQVRHDGAVTCVEIRERGNGVEVVWQKANRAKRSPPATPNRPRFSSRNAAKVLGCNLVLTRVDLELLKQLKAAGDLGRNVGGSSSRVTLDRLARGGFVVARLLGTDSVQYRITQRGRDAIVEHDL